jgi:D-alanyl-D-alanine endopeptidase (penicillin-binding protein 7)
MRWAAFVTIYCAVAGARAQADTPDVRSKSAVLLDAETGAEVWAKDADDVRAIASTTKIFVAMAVRKQGLDLDGWTEITKDDARAAAGGAKTRLDVGQSFKNIDILRAMLMASDNRAPTALGRAAGMTPKQLVAAMNGIAKDLGLKHTRFTDTSGLRGNVSTAREMALAVRAALSDDVVRDVMGTDSVIVKSRSGYEKIRYGNTDRALGSKWTVIGGKTGYTEAAGYCFVVGARIAGHDVAMAFLGADGKAARFSDFAKVAEWIDGGAPGAKVKLGAHPTRARPRLSVSARGHVDE